MKFVGNFSKIILCRTPPENFSYIHAMFHPYSSCIAMASDYQSYLVALIQKVCHELWHSTVTEQLSSSGLPECFPSLLPLPPSIYIFYICLTIRVKMFWKSALCFDFFKTLFASIKTGSLKVCKSHLLTLIHLFLLLYAKLWRWRPLDLHGIIWPVIQKQDSDVFPVAQVI